MENLVTGALADEEVFHQDEADAHLNPKMGATYMKPGQKLLVLTPGKNVKRYVFGALNTRTGRVVHGVAESKNAAPFVQCSAGCECSLGCSEGRSGAPVGSFVPGLGAVEAIAAGRIARTLNSSQYWRASDMPPLHRSRG
jgi:putative transposase